MDNPVECPMEVDAHIPAYTGPRTACVRQWMKKFEDGSLTTTNFKEYWRIWVPKIFSPVPNTSCLEWSIKEDTAQEILLNPLEEFICNGETKEVFKYLGQLDNPPSVCGRVVKRGEPTYNCRECGMDSTCVLCVDCFKQSSHKNHKYKMSTSRSGGCCDCGDLEAWKKDPVCDTHLIGLKKRNSSSGLPDDLSRRAYIVFLSVLRYAYQLLTLECAPSLPSELKLKDCEDGAFDIFSTADMYCTVLYNDETHTFEQVISTLSRVIKCSQRDAIEFVTNIDREGRAVVKCSIFQLCTELKSDIERFTSRHGTRPLKVLVVHAHVIAHQIFALRLLTWLQKMMTLSEGFRTLFTQVALAGSSPDSSILEGILRRDSTLWKSARLHWHRLFISAMLMEYESKKSFAKVFTRNYGSVMKDFIRDDHDHSFSVASLGVQVFTVPTLAHYLIAEESVLFVLFNSFISECSRKCNKLGKLEFERNAPSSPFKRAIYILYDLRYVLGAPPTSWSDALRRGFLQGVSLLLVLLNYMQGMDSVTRQVGQHMEYEPEWESAFNLHIKLAPVITMMLQWCGTDRVVLIKAYRLTLKKLYENPCFEPAVVGALRELADHSASCLDYDVSSQPVSIHLPLSRFLAGLHLHLEAYSLTFDSPEFHLGTKQTPEQLIEPVLRTQVMISQVHAGMWRRNGYSLSNQIYFYHNVKCRGEMMDKDIIMLQIGASLIESNEFLIHVLNKFDLIGWANPNFEKTAFRNPEEESIRQTVSLVEEFLSLMINIIGVRYNPGVGKVTPDDCMKKEITQLLCIRSFSHSEINKSLPDDVNHETGMERVISDIAVFKKPKQSSGKGVYELKPEYFKHYDVFFYHYTKEELSKSEEEQRKRQKERTGLECCPPPVLPPFSEPFHMVANLLQCDVMLHVMKIVLERSINLRDRTFSEAQVQKVLHLIGYALQEEEQQYSQFITFTDRAEKWGIEKLLEELYGSPRVEAHNDLIKWTLNKFRQVTAPKRKLEALAEEDESPVESKSAEQIEKENKAKLAAERRAQVMAQMATMQMNFMKDNAALFEEAQAESLKDLKRFEMEIVEPSIDCPIALGPNQSQCITNARSYTCILCQEELIVSPNAPAMVLAAFVQKSTVLCQNRSIILESEDETHPLFLTSNLGPAPHTSSCGHVMHSTCWQNYFDNVLARENRRPYRSRQPSSFDVEKNEYLCPLCECLNNTVLPIIPDLISLPNAKSKETVDKLTFGNWLDASVIAIKHKKKVEKTIVNRDTASKPGVSASKKMREEPRTVDSVSAHLQARSAMGGEAASQGSPIVVSDNSSVSYVDSDDTDDDDDVTTAPVNKFISLGESDVIMQLRVYSGAEKSSEGEPDEVAQPVLDRGLSNELLEMILLFSQATYIRGLGVNPHLDDPRVPLMAWKSCAYSIHALEWLLRYQDKPLLGDLSCRQQDCLENLIKLSGVLGSAWKHNQVINRHGVKLLTMIIDNKSTDPAVTDWDSFGVLVPLTTSLPNMFYSDPVPVPLGTILELHSFTLMFYSNIAQIIIYSDLITECSGDVVHEETQCLNTLVKLLKDTPPLDTSKVWNVIRKNSWPFLRCCAIFYHYLTGVPPSAPLTEARGDTFEALCSYLGVPSSCKELLDHQAVYKLFKQWGSHEKVVAMAESPPFRDMTAMNELVKLPDDYSELINTVSLFTCPNSDREDSRNPTMCLVCGEMLCSQTYCCQTELNKTLVGACTYHAHTCGSGAGVFLRVRDCEVLLLACPNRGTFTTPPYLDDYGETDQGLRRGNPLRLCHQRYTKLQLLWLSHCLYEEIARSIESSTTLVNTQWQHL